MAVLVSVAVTALGIGHAGASEPSATVRWFGDTSSATGAALAQGACDVDADGYDDAVVGAWFWDKAPNNNVGAAYVLFGGPQVAGGDLNDPVAAGAARIDGPSTANAFVGFSVACLGDVNGDDIDDLAISYYVQERVFVVLGAEEFGDVDLANLGERGFQVLGDPTDALDYNVGFSMAPVGDHDDDGLADFAVAGVVADTQGRTNNGRVWIVAGKDDVADVDLIAPDEGDVLSVIDGRGNEDRLGSVAPAGDVNGDGVDDLVVGAYTATPWGAGVAVPGAAWVVWGGGDGTVDLANVGEEGFAVHGPQRGRDRLGISVAGAGDVNGDGLDDVIIGGDGVYNAATGPRTGSAWVVFGADSNATVYTATAPDATAAVFTCAPDAGAGTCAPDETAARGYWIVGADSDPGNGTEGTGYSLSGIGDVNADGTPDFAIGAYGYDPVNPANPAATMSGAGAVWIVHGKATTATQDLAALTPDDGYRIDGLAAGDRFGRQVAGLGDLDGNGVADFAGAGDFAQRPLPPGTPRSQAGEVAVALLGPLATDTALTTDAADDTVALDGSVVLTATVTRAAGGAGPVGVGTVTFAVDGSTVAGCVDVPVVTDDGTATCPGATFAARGTHTVSAAYTGDESHADSASDPFELLVTEPSTTTLEASALHVGIGEEITATATVVGSISNAPADAGSVSFSVEGIEVPACAAAAVATTGEASCTLSADVDPGTYTATASYTGTDGLESSDAAPIELVVSRRCSGLLATVDLGQQQSPTTGDDVVVGTSAADDLDTLGGADLVCALVLADTVNAGAGNDTVVGDRGADELYGGQGDDTLGGGRGNDELYGGAGDDLLRGGELGDLIVGGKGADTIRCGGGYDVVIADRFDSVAADCELVRGER
ncbi:MAG: FG-GAP repeat protein [Acidimicrobiales bacterium]|nr:FG-GAP repeat protein [Acidimicrobiales bacterium]